MKYLKLTNKERAEVRLGKNNFLRYLTIEVTRRCNFKCSHCLRGDADQTMFDPTVLHEFLYLNNIKDIGTLTLTGGEPFLAAKVVQRIISELRMANVEVCSYYIATNGSTLLVGNMPSIKETLSIIDDLNLLCGDDEGSGIRISNSKWHKEERRKIGLSEWLPCSRDALLEHAVEVLTDTLDETQEGAKKDMYDSEWEAQRSTEIDRFFSEFSSINNGPMIYTEKPSDYHNIVAEGRGKGVKTDLTKKPPDKMEDMIYLSAKGELILNYCDYSYASAAKAHAERLKQLKGDSK